MTSLTCTGRSRETTVYQTPPRPWPGRRSGAARSDEAQVGVDAPYVLCVGRVELRKNGRLDVPPPPGTVSAASCWCCCPRDDGAYDPHQVLPPVGRKGDVLVTAMFTDDPQP